MPHLAVIRTLRPHMGPTTFTFWTVKGSDLPITWNDAINHLKSPSGRTTP
jgi:hypothetical protein